MLDATSRETNRDLSILKEAEGEGVGFGLIETIEAERKPSKGARERAIIWVSEVSRTVALARIS